jgi:hypothetical protein
MLVISSANIEWKYVDYAEWRGRVGRFIGTPATMHSGPQAFLVEIQSPGGTISPHFHDVDQFQVVIDGSGAIGKRKVEAVVAQYANAYTAYGPIVADDHLSYFTLRLAASGAFFPMPGSGSKIPKGVARRNVVSSACLGSIPTVADQTDLTTPSEDGMQIESVRIPPNQQAYGAQGNGGGQYYVVCSGSLVHGDALLPRRSLIHVERGENAALFVAGPAGVELLVVQFPRPSERPGSDPEILAQRAMTYQVLPGAHID